MNQIPEAGVPPKDPLLDSILEESRVVRDESQRAEIRDAFAEALALIRSRTATAPQDVEALLESRIAEIDRTLSRQVEAILRHPDSQKLEASWRGLEDLVWNTARNRNLEIWVFPVSHEELAADLSPSSPDQPSALEAEIQNRVEAFDGVPFSLLVGDFEFGPRARDATILRQMAAVAARAHAPFLAAAGPTMFGCVDFEELSAKRDLSEFPGRDGSPAWNALRDSEDARFVALTLPRFLLRGPHGGPHGRRVSGFRFQAEQTDHESSLWGNSAYALASRILASFARHNWGSAIQGVQGGGLVERLPMHGIETEAGTMEDRCPLEIPISERLERQLSELGFTPLCHQKHTDTAVFVSTPSLNRPRAAGNAIPRGALDLVAAARLPIQLAVCRFANSLKMVIRGRIGSPMSRSQMELYLNNWIHEYVGAFDEASPALRAEFPLREAEIAIVTDPDRPGCFQVVGRLRPRFLVEEPAGAIPFVIDWPR